MRLQVQIKMNDALFLRDPQGSELGKKIIQNSIRLIYKQGFEALNFKKLAEDIGTTEAGIYRYFENKHRLLIYVVAWYGVGSSIKLGFKQIISRTRKSD